MPGGDGTGPMGMGPMTGRAAGFCAGNNMPGYMNPMPGRGFGRGFFGRGGGRGWRNMYYATGLFGWQRAAGGYPVPAVPMAPAMTREQQANALKAQAESLENTLENIRSQLAELEKQK